MYSNDKKDKKKQKNLIIESIPENTVFDNDDLDFDSDADIDCFNDEFLDEALLDNDILDTENLDNENLDTENLETEIPEHDILEHDILESDILENDTLDTDALDTDALDTDALDTDALDTDALDTDALDTDALDPVVLDNVVLNHSVLDSETSDVDNLNDIISDDELLTNENFDDVSSEFENANDDNDYQSPYYDAIDENYQTDDNHEYDEHIMDEKLEQLENSENLHDYGLTKLNKNKNKTRLTFNYLTVYEKILLLGVRTQQIANRSAILIDTSKLTKITPYEIAKEELRRKKIPFKIKRSLPNGTFEIWDISELTIL